MTRLRLCALAATVGLAALALAPAVASAQVAPRMMIAFDTSGSMALDLDGTPTFGDGIVTNCTQMPEGHLCGVDCTAGIDTDCDGAANDSRMAVAKAALRDMLWSTGTDIDFGLARFSQRHATDAICSVTRMGAFITERLSIDVTECNLRISSYGNPQCNTDGVISQCGDFGGPPPGPWFVDTADWPAACRPGSGGNPPLEAYDALDAWNNSDGDPLTNPLVCLDYEPDACDATARSGDVLVGFSDTGAYSGRSNLPGLLRWIDDRETAWNTTSTEGNWCNHAGTGDCELRPVGPTPLSGTLLASRDFIVSTRSGDAAASCRPYSIILLSDGNEFCGGGEGDPAAVAQTLFDDDAIRTYVIGVSIDPAEQPTLDAIASNGGTGGAFFADNRAALAAALSQIVADSVLVEVCNGADDDCDGLIDEGVSNACGTCGPPPSEVCDGDDDDCDGNTDEGVSNACGTCGAVPPEVCNRLDDDCDGNTDEDGAGGSVCDACTPTAEVCDDVDNDCDTRVDEGVTRACGTDIGECTSGTESCSAGAWSGVCVGSSGPSAEVCNGLDDDCDGTPDDGVTRPCGDDTGECVAGFQQCIGDDVWGPCVGEVGPSAEVCDGEDDDCDGTIDNGVPDGGSCGTGLGICTPGTLRCMGGTFVCQGGTGPAPGGETCDNRDEDCDGRTDEGVPTMGPCGSDVGECREGVLSCVSGAFVCVGARGPTTEICNGLDDDCADGIDEGNPGGGASCGTDDGECTAGTTRCIGGALVCDGEVRGTPEVCDGEDDDCDGVIDEGNPGGGAACGASDVGLCAFGAIACVSGSLVCVGETGPSAELCDGADNDCDGDVDEMNPEGGAACGDDTGACMAGTFLCTGGALVCDGAVGPVPETCNGIDDDCDGVIDDGIAVGAACGTDVGECVPGVNICRAGGLVCEGAIEPETEVCDNLDNDCDGRTDEGLGIGDACGTDEGLCLPGVQRCIAGRLVCEGEVGPRREGCDCNDNDCDGTVDEAPETGAICPPGAACVDCQCALPCTESGEFGFTCPTGKTPQVATDGETCFCVAPLCDPAECGAETVERDGDVLCAPGSDDVAPCVCSNNECTFSCDGVVCAEGTVCNPRDPLGRCVENSCRGLGCGAGEVCDQITGECVVDACEGVSCPADQACRAGDCEPVCAGVTCAAGERCRAGSCDADPCEAVDCDFGEICHPTDGGCVEDLCAAVRCAGGQVCDVDTGSCVADPCNTLRCPEGTQCEAGECVEGPMPEVDAGVDAGGIDAGPTRPGDGRERVLAGGGCICHVGTRSETPRGLPFAALGLLGALLWRRRRRRRPRREGGRVPFVAVVGAALALGLGTGCEVDPFCLDCGEVPDDDAGPDAGDDAAIGRRDAGPPDAGTDGGPDGGPCGEERCNDVDDDCDGEVDEGIDTNTDLENCGACGALCAPLGAFGACNAGRCEIDSCDVGRLDIDGDPDNGCEYRCLVESDDDAVCDRRDNDCDAEVDEDVDLDTDPVNCGACGVTCSYAHGTGTCEAGACRLSDCDDDWFDVDGSDTNGCEYSCVAADPAVEACNGRDDDCDGSVDEGDPGGGASCGTDVGLCMMGVEACVGGTIVCTGGVEPDLERCNGDDDDCDGDVDESNPEGGRVCGTSTGTCTAGREQCIDGALECVGATGPGDETCNGLDDDCDGTIDDGNPDGGGSCGGGTVNGAPAICRQGTLTCTGGTVTCVGAIPPEAAEECDNQDDDCDGDVDEGNPEGGASCGTDLGVCVPGTLTCQSGGLVCIGATGPDPGGETCNGLDDDCDGTPDDGNPGGGVNCGNDTGECVGGVTSCSGGVLQCVNRSSGPPITGPTLETCDGEDDDCDGMTDEDFMPFTSRTHCGSCNTPCVLDQATSTCASGTCEIAACNAGFVDFDGVASNGCEYACDFNGDEICNGVDDDCDMRTDEDLTPPGNLCDPDGVCAMTTATCAGSGGWVCNYPSTFEETEETCDGEDNDCDGMVDEPFLPALGTGCANGTGGCRRTGTIVCTSDGTATECNAAPAGTPAAFESCNDVDDDCDGAVDEDIPDSAIPTVTIPRSGGGTVDVMVYEASRPDADATDPGQVEDRACSNPGVVPWTNVTWAEARDACCALNASGTCAGGGNGWRLCDAADWQTACEGPSASCFWSYATSCDTSAPMTCNGFESGAGIEASAAYAMCFTDWSSAGVIYDLSGNVKEWTNTETIPGVHQIRGGAYNNVEDGRACAFDFTAADMTFSFPHTGFRCCRY